MILFTRQNTNQLLKVLATYLAVSTRPDIAFSVNNLACFNSDSQKEHWTALKQILRYLKCTTNIGILYKQDECDKCIGYGDAD